MAAAQLLEDGLLSLFICVHIVGQAFEEPLGIIGENNHGAFPHAFRNHQFIHAAGVCVKVPDRFMAKQAP